MPWHGLNSIEMTHALLLAIIPTIIGHTALNYSMKVLRGQVVGILNLTQFIWASLFGYIFFAEIPGMTFLSGSFITCHWHWYHCDQS